MAIADCMLELAMLRPLRIYIRKPVRCSLLPYEASPCCSNPTCWRYGIYERVYD